MLTNSWRRYWSQAAWGLALVLLAPAFVQAQHTGLFPLAPVRRERVPCPNEDPVYRLYRQQYFGYHPTCWRRFPPNWGCPSPEAPNPEASYAKIPKQPLPPSSRDLEEDEETAPKPDRGGMPDRGNRPNATDLPALPRNEGSLFDQGKPGQAQPPTTPPPGDRPGPPPGASSTVRPLEAPADVVTNPPQGAQPDAREAPAAGAIDPLLALPDPTTSTGTVPGTSMTPQPSGDPSTASSGFPDQAPQRRSVIGGFFNKLGFRRR